MRPVDRIVQQVETGQQDFRLETGLDKPQMVVVQDIQIQAAAAAAPAAGSQLVVKPDLDSRWFVVEDIQHLVVMVVDFGDGQRVAVADRPMVARPSLDIQRVVAVDN